MKKIALLLGLMCIATYFLLDEKEREEIAEIWENL